MLKRVVLALIEIYRGVSRFFPPRCRFYPSCSLYTWQAVNRYGVVRGLYLGGLRLLKCHPFHPGGVDMVPRSGDNPLRSSPL